MKGIEILHASLERLEEHLWLSEDFSEQTLRLITKNPHWKQLEPEKAIAFAERTNYSDTIVASIIHRLDVPKQTAQELIKLAGYRWTPVSALITREDW